MRANKTNIQVKAADKLWLSTNEAMKYLDCSARFLEQLREEGEITYSRYSKKSIWYLKSSIDRFLSKHIVGERPSGLLPASYV